MMKVCFWDKFSGWKSTIFQFQLPIPNAQGVPYMRFFCHSQNPAVNVDSLEPLQTWTDMFAQGWYQESFHQPKLPDWHTHSIDQIWPEQDLLFWCWPSLTSGWNRLPPQSTQNPIAWAPNEPLCPSPVSQARKTDQQNIVLNESEHIPNTSKLPPMVTYNANDSSVPHPPTWGCVLW